MSRGSAPALALLAVLAALPARADEFDEIVSSIRSDNHEEICGRMSAWIERSGGDPRAPRGLLWMAQIRRNDQRDDLARPLYQRVVRDAPGSSWALHARKGLGDVDLAAHQYASAIARYQSLAALPDAHWKYVGSNAAAYARGERVRFQILVALAALLLSSSLLQLARAGRAGKLWPPPREVVWSLPVLLGVFVASFAQEPAEAAALRTLAASALALLWAQGAALRASTRFWVPALAGVAQTVALLYCALVGNGLWAKLVDTVAMGGE